MPTPRITMRQLRQILRLHFESGLSMRECSRVLGTPKSTVYDALRMSRVAGIDWLLAQTLTNDQLEARVYPSVDRSRGQHVDLDYAHIHREIKRKGVTLQLLWEEYAAANPLAYKYTAFCVKYRAWTQSLKRSMRQIHIAGDKLFVDYAGQTLPIIDPSTGEIRRAQIFVAVLGASNYTYARATATQTAVDWVGSIIDAMEFIGGVPCLIVPDQPRALFAHPDRYEPKPGLLVEELTDHYAVAVLPARPAHPRDKPKVEVAVQIVERWILARLRNRRFFSLLEVNMAIAELLIELNQRPFKKLPGCRREAFESLDQPVLRPLPPERMQIARLKRARVNIDYHVEFDHHYYSVPHRLVGTEVDVRATDLTVEVMAGGKRVAVHAYSALKGRHTTLSGSGRRPSSSPGASASELPRPPSCAGKWRTVLTPSRATAPAWGCSDWHASTPRSAWRRLAHARCRSSRKRTAASARSSRAGWTVSNRPSRSRPRCRCTTTCAAPTITTDPLTTKEIELLNEQTLTQLKHLRLDGMVAALDDDATSSVAAGLGFAERLSMLVQREIDWRDNKRLARLLKAPASRTSSGAPRAIWIATWSRRWPAATGFGMLAASWSRAAPVRAKRGCRARWRTRPHAAASRCCTPVRRA